MVEGQRLAGRAGRRRWLVGALERIGKLLLQLPDALGEGGCVGRRGCRAARRGAEALQLGQGVRGRRGLGGPAVRRSGGRAVRSRKGGWHRWHPEGESGAEGKPLVACGRRLLGTARGRRRGELPEARFRTASLLIGAVDDLGLGAARARLVAIAADLARPALDARERRPVAAPGLSGLGDSGDRGCRCRRRGCWRWRRRRGVRVVVHGSAPDGRRRRGLQGRDGVGGLLGSRYYTGEKTGRRKKTKNKIKIRKKKKKTEDDGYPHAGRQGRRGRRMQKTPRPRPPRPRQPRGEREVPGRSRQWSTTLLPQTLRTFTHFALRTAQQAARDGRRRDRTGRILACGFAIRLSPQAAGGGSGGGGGGCLL